MKASDSCKIDVLKWGIAESASFNPESMLEELSYDCYL
jgi:hypothetical protein